MEFWCVQGEDLTIEALHRPSHPLKPGPLCVPQRSLFPCPLAPSHLSASVPYCSEASYPRDALRARGHLPGSSGSPPLHWRQGEGLELSKWPAPPGMKMSPPLRGWALAHRNKLLPFSPFPGPSPRTSRCAEQALGPRAGQPWLCASCSGTPG